MANIIEKFKALNKKTKRLIAIILSAVLLVSAVSVTLVVLLTDKQDYDPETQPVVFAIGALDQNFNPFFATSATDTEVIGMTQVGLITSDKAGKPVSGADQPTVALDHKITEHKNTDGDVEYTDYEFLIKNGIKFSDNTDLTIKDVLFNLYVYLDPVYTGSATIYSTDIQGLKSYRAQMQVDDDYSGNLDETYYNTAQTRIDNIIEYATGETDEKPAGYDKDVARIGELFLEEVTSDWNANVGMLESYASEYSFTEDWQSFYMNSGLVYNQDMVVNPDGTREWPKDSNGKYLMNINNADGSVNEDNALVEEIREATTQAKIDAYIATNGGTAENAKDELIKAHAIQAVYSRYFPNSIDEILYYWQTGVTIQTEFIAEARTDYFETADGVSSISGITAAYGVTEFNGKSLAAEHDVLKIRINGVDPKAIWNFAFTVSPMSYYSGVYQKEDESGNVVSTTDYVAAYNGTTNFGVAVGDYDFFQKVLKGTAKSGKPIGAGVYMATNSTDSGDVTRNNFFNNGVVYYKRNPYFYTLGIDGYDVTKDELAKAENDTEKPIHNAIIKYFNYQVVPEDKILTLLADGTIHYGEPSSSSDNYKKLDQYKDTLDFRDYPAGGYGYVGINPKFVPQLELRRAIMKAMDVGLMIDEYYSGGRASVIYRPMSKTSWAYPETATEHENIKYATSDAEIEALVVAAGYTKDTDGYYKNNDTGEKITLKFTIAGGSTDHPATVMFEAAARRLNALGFDITVGTDVNALKNLATGNLAVWAAAWSSAIDPDMYQVYHKNSTATSVLNWNYKEILYTDEYPREKTIVNQLSDLIDKARKTTIEAERISYYGQALDKVMELAVELPTYQRKELAVYNKVLIDAETLNDDPSWMAGVVNELWKLNFN